MHRQDVDRTEAINLQLCRPGTERWRSEVDLAVMIFIHRAGGENLCDLLLHKQVARAADVARTDVFEEVLDVNDSCRVRCQWQRREQCEMKDKVTNHAAI